MKHLYVLAAFLLLLVSARAQHYMFLPFGLKVEEVKSFLASKDYIESIEEDNETHAVRAVMEENRQVEYAFEAGRLYATTLTRNYRDKQEAKAYERSTLEYMEQVGRGVPVRSGNVDGVQCYTVLADTRIVKLFVQTHAESVTLTLASLSKQFGPANGDFDAYYEDELLQRRFIAN